MSTPTVVSVDDLPTSQAKWVSFIILTPKGPDSLGKVGLTEENHLA